MNHVKFIGLFSAALFAFVGDYAQSADLLNGKTLTYQHLFPTQTDVFYQAPDFIVGPGVELQFLHTSPSDVATLDVSDTNILIDYYAGSNWDGSGSFNGFRLVDSTNSIPAFTSVTINPITNMPGFNASRISFDANNIFVNWSGLTGFDADTIVSLDLTAVPEPTSAALAACVFALVALYRTLGPLRSRD